MNETKHKTESCRDSTSKNGNLTSKRCESIGTKSARGCMSANDVVGAVTAFPILKKDDDDDDDDDGDDDDDDGGDDDDDDGR